MPKFPTVKWSYMSRFKFKYGHAQVKILCSKPGDKYRIDVILGDSTYCKIKTEEIHKGKPGDPIVVGTTFSWVTHECNDHVTDQAMFVREVND